MLQIKCPYCGLRDEQEFSCGGEAHISRPLAENPISDKDFADYLFYRHNPKGVFLERWMHAAGCRRWFNLARDTYSHEIIEIYEMGSLPKTTAAKKAYATNWRRSSAAEQAAQAQNAPQGKNQTGKVR